MRCRSGTFSDEISSTSVCRPHTDCASKGECVVHRGHHRRDNVCGTCAGNTTITDSTSNDTTGLHTSDGENSLGIENVFWIVLVVVVTLVLAIWSFVLYNINFREGRLISKKQFQLYNNRIMAELTRQKEAERIAFDLCQRVEEENIHLKNQVESEKGEVARLKDQITHFTTKNMSTYSFSRKPCGIAVIINNIHFEDMADRGGAEGDTGRLREAFESLSFTAMTFSDLDHSKMVATIKDQAKADHSNYDCFACCIMSHGTTGKVFSSDDVGLDICDLMKLFNANKCPSLKGKPKLFFIQASQGKKIQGKESIEGDLDATPGEDVPLNVICHDADFFLGLATVPGYVTKRGKDGAPYVLHLAQMLKVLGPMHSLSTIMAMVCDKMNDINDDKFGWISSNHSTLRKEVIFNVE
ncbi:caspase-3-like [Branchiostoma floridae]|uniref:Caspase-3-like n=1 Tax=Branchiostoma floridae TaxID=7739 RepID=A0A9J7NB12_BRAFL|nr:caspase-3-like [Branchiostoma floridae]